MKKKMSSLEQLKKLNKLVIATKDASAVLIFAATKFKKEDGSIIGSKWKLTITTKTVEITTKPVIVASIIALKRFKRMSHFMSSEMILNDLIELYCKNLDLFNMDIRAIQNSKHTTSQDLAYSDDLLN